MHEHNTDPAARPARRECPSAGALADRIREQGDDITRRWLERVAEREEMDLNAVFPTEALLDHVPMLITAIADFIEDPAEELTAGDVVVAKALELGELRHEQGVRPNEILKEFEILGGILLTVMGTEVESIDGECSAAEAFVCAHRLHRALAVIERMTTTHYLRLKDERLNEREQRLRGFNRMVSHEMKNRVGAVINAAVLLEEDWLPEVKRRKMLSIVAENGRGMAVILDNLLELSQVDPTDRRSRDIPLRKVAGEVIRQLRDTAAARQVDVRLDEGLPRVDVNGPVAELALTNYISNAIKYSDPSKSDRRVRVRAMCSGEDGSELVVEVEDNGMGVPDGARGQLFDRFFRVDDLTSIEGSGLGLSIVRETVESFGGRVFARFDGDAGGSIFGFALPFRRHRDDAGPPA